MINKIVLNGRPSKTHQFLCHPTNKSDSISIINLELTKI